MVEDSGMLSEVPESLRRYFDYEAFARDLFCDGYFMSDGFVFHH
ncbi:antirestriction protein ArdA [Salmonella enterica]|nr:antirestriction protein ArdA [Salmonella enterica]